MDLQLYILPSFTAHDVISCRRLLCDDNLRVACDIISVRKATYVSKPSLGSWIRTTRASWRLIWAHEYVVHTRSRQAGTLCVGYWQQRNVRLQVCNRKAFKNGPQRDVLLPESPICRRCMHRLAKGGDACCRYLRC